MNIELTQLTAEEYNLLLSGRMTPAMASITATGGMWFTRSFCGQTEATRKPEISFRLFRRSRGE